MSFSTIEARSTGKTVAPMEKLLCNNLASNPVLDKAIHFLLF